MDLVNQHKSTSKCESQNVLKHKRLFFHFQIRSFYVLHVVINLNKILMKHFHINYYKHANLTNLMNICIRQKHNV